MGRIVDHSHSTASVLQAQQAVRPCNLGLQKVTRYRSSVQKVKNINQCVESARGLAARHLPSTTLEQLACLDNTNGASITPTLSSQLSRSD